MILRALFFCLTLLPCGFAPSSAPPHCQSSIMRLALLNTFCLFLYFSHYSSCFPSPRPRPSLSQEINRNNDFSSKHFPKASMIFRYCIAIILWWFLVLSILPNTRFPVRFVTYSTNISTQRKLYSEKPWFSEKFLLFLFITMNCENVSVIIICLAEFIPSGLHLISKIISSLYYPRKDLVNISLLVLGNVINLYSNPPILSLFFESFYYSHILSSFYYDFPAWISILILILSNDIEPNPGDFRNGFLTFCNWNINSLSKNNFERIPLLDAHNSAYDYDIISLCEISLNDSTVLPDILSIITNLYPEKALRGESKAE